MRRSDGLHIFPEPSFFGSGDRNVEIQPFEIIES